MANLHGKLTLSVIRARDLHDTQTFGKQDPYAEYWIGDTKPDNNNLQKTKVCKDGGKEAYWGEPDKDRNVSVFAVEPHQREFHLMIINMNSLKNDEIGRLDAPLQQLIEKEGDIWYAIKRGADGKPAGNVLIRANWLPNTPAAPAPAAAPVQAPSAPASAPAAQSSAAPPYGYPAAVPYGQPAPTYAQPPAYAQPVAAYPQPAYGAPAAVYAQPAPVFGQPVFGQPVYGQPAPVYGAPAPAPVYGQPAPVYGAPNVVYVRQAPAPGPYPYNPNPYGPR